MRAPPPPAKPDFERELLRSPTNLRLRRVSTEALRALDGRGETGTPGALRCRRRGSAGANGAESSSRDQYATAREAVWADVESADGVGHGEDRMPREHRDHGEPVSDRGTGNDSQKSWPKSVSGRWTAASDGRTGGLRIARQSATAAGSRPGAAIRTISIGSHSPKRRTVLSSLAPDPSVSIPTTSSPSQRS